MAEKRWSPSGLGLTAGFGLGAFLMYYLDPDRGNYRRALARDKLVHYRKVARRRSLGRVRDLEHRARGFFASIRSGLRARFSGEPIPDEKLIARVASRIGRVVSHPHALGITAEDGIVFLSGQTLAEEIPALIACVRRVPGVKGIRNQLEERTRVA